MTLKDAFASSPRQRARRGVCRTLPALHFLLLARRATSSSITTQAMEVQICDPCASEPSDGVRANEGDHFLRGPQE